MKQILTIMIVTLFSGLAGCRESAPPASTVQEVAAQTFIVRQADGQGVISVTGVVKAHLESDLSAQIVAPVAFISKREGDHFRTGEVLVRLYAPELNAGVAQAKATLESVQEQEQGATAQATLAAANLSRYEQLRERHSVTPYELDQMKAQSSATDAQRQGAAAKVSAARSAMAIQQANAEDANLYAPFDGVVTRRLIDPGAMAAPGVPLLHLESSGAHDVEFSVPEALFDSLRIGTPLEISPGDETPLTGRVATIAPSGNAGSHSFVVKASLPAKSAWHSGTVVQVALPSKDVVSHIVVPAGAVAQQGGLDAVLAIGADGMASVRYVTLGSTRGGMTEILTGVRAGDRLIAKANLEFAGRKIEVLP